MKRYPRFLELSNGQIATHDPDMLRLIDALHHEPRSITELAALAGISPSTIRSWRRLKTCRPQHVTLISLALAMGYTLTLSRKKVSK